MKIERDPISVFGLREGPDTATDAQLPVSVSNSHAPIVGAAVEKYRKGCSGPGEKPGHPTEGATSAKTFVNGGVA
jgi:hypothetical protein